MVLLPFGLYLSPVSQGYRWPLRRQIPCFTGDVMVGGHIFQLGRSTSLHHVNALDIRLMVASKNCEELLSGRRSASSYRLLRSPVMRSTGRTMILQGLGCSFVFPERVFVRFSVNIRSLCNIFFRFLKKIHSHSLLVSHDGWPRRHWRTVRRGRARR